MNLFFCNILLWNIDSVVLHVMLQHVSHTWIALKYPFKLAYEVVVWVNPACCLMAHHRTSRNGNKPKVTVVHRIVSTCSHCFAPPLLLLAHPRF